MGNDTPDWAGQYNNAAQYPLFDMAELAARLGSPVTIDRRGALLWSDNFEYGLNPWTIVKVGAASAVSLVVTPVEHGAFAGKIVIDSNEDDLVQMTKSLAVPLTAQVGLSATFQLSSSADTVDIQIVYFDGTNQHVFRIRLDFNTQELKVFQQAGYTAVGALPLGATATGYYTFGKIVANITDLRYERGIFAGTEYDLSAFTPFTSLSSTTPRIKATIQFPNTTGSLSRTYYLDNVLITANEPPNA